MTQAETSGGPALVWCPFPDGDSAAAAADILIAERLIVCANILPAMRSLFAWQGERGDAQETGVLFKTDGSLHPYSEPAIVGWRCDAAAPTTAAWLGALAA